MVLTMVLTSPACRAVSRSIIGSAFANGLAHLCRCGTSQHGLCSKKMTLITSDCGATRSLRIKCP